MTGAAPMLENLQNNFQVFRNTSSISSTSSRFPLVSDFLYFTLTFLIATFYFLVRLKRVQFARKKPFSETLQRLQWTRVNLQFLDGLILFYKLRKHGIQIFNELVDKYERLALRVPLGFVNVIGVGEPEIIQKLLSSSSPGHLSKHKFLYETVFSEYLKDGLLASDVATWSSHRKPISQAFRYNSFPTYLKFISNGASELLQSALHSASKSPEGELNNKEMKEIIDRHVVKIITQIILGSENFDISDEERCEFHGEIKKLKELTVYRLLHPELFLSPVWMFHPKKWELSCIIANMTKFSEKIIENYRLVNSKESENNPEHIDESPVDEFQSLSEESVHFECLVEKMIKAGFTNKEIFDEIATFLTAGHETILVALDFLIFQLAQNSEHQRKCQIEVDSWFMSKEHDSWSPSTPGDLSQLKYLERCILESMRLTPTVPAFVRHLQEPLEIEKSCFIEAGQSILVVPWITHRSPKIYPNPGKFDPDRFLPENIRQRHPGAYIPFSLGARNCIGMKIAIIEMKLIMANILKGFDLSTSECENDVKILFDITLKPERPFNVTFKKRGN